jgi:hypothetical protein
VIARPLPRLLARLLWLGAFLAAVCGPALATVANAQLENARTSTLTGITLPSGALRIADNKTKADFVAILQQSAQNAERVCQSHEVLIWQGPTFKASQSQNIMKAVADALTKASFEYRLLDKGKDGNTSVSLVSAQNPKLYALGLWVADNSYLLLGWCNAAPSPAASATAANNLSSASAAIGNTNAVAGSGDPANAAPTGTAPTGTTPTGTAPTSTTPTGTTPTGTTPTGTAPANAALTATIVLQDHPNSGVAANRLSRVEAGYSLRLVLASGNGAPPLVIERELGNGLPVLTVASGSYSVTAFLLAPDGSSSRLRLASEVREGVPNLLGPAALLNLTAGGSLKLLLAK